MTKYFYTDPLSAAWMAKHFGMRFDLNSLERLYSWATEMQMPMDKYYIHPDSEHLLEPKDGDIDNKGNIYCAQFGYWEDNIKLNVGPPIDQDKWNGKIIYRNGIPFHWPDKED